MAVGQEAVVADALKAGRNGVLQEAADELVGGEGHHLGLVAVPVILPLEGNLVVFESQEAPVGDGHAVGIAAEIRQDMLWSTEGGLGVDHPLVVFEGRSEEHTSELQSLRHLVCRLLLEKKKKKKKDYNLNNTNTHLTDIWTRYAV